MISLLFSPLDPDDLRLAGLTLRGPAVAQGLLLDGWGHPFLCLGHDGEVKGHLHAIAEEDRDDVLTSLDRHHDVLPGGLRRTIAAVAGELVWTYHWTGRMDLPHVAGGDWRAHRDPRLL